MGAADPPLGNLFGSSPVVPRANRGANSCPASWTSDLSRRFASSVYPLAAKCWTEACYYPLYPPFVFPVRVFFFVVPKLPKISTPSCISAVLSLPRVFLTKKGGIVRVQVWHICYVSIHIQKLFSLSLPPLPVSLEVTNCAFLARILIYPNA